MANVAVTTLSEFTIRIRVVVTLGARLDQAALDRERADPSQDVPAVLLVGDGRLVHAQLQEEVVDVGVAAVRWRDDRDLGGQRVGTAEPVDLQRMAAAHDPQQQGVPLLRLRWQIGG